MIQTIRNITSLCLLTAGIVAVLGTVCITTPELSPGEMAGQLMWVARGCMAFGICGILSVIIRTPSSGYTLPGFPQLVSWILICLGGIQAIWGMRQIYGYAYSNHSLFALTGSFFNPGPYSGYLAMILPVSLYEWLKLRTRNTRTISEQAGYYLSLMVLLLIICVLPAGMSRSAWIASVVSCGLVLAIHYSWIQKLKEQWKEHRSRTVVLFTALLIMLVLGGGLLFSIKKDLASGRLFMWKISATAIWNNPMGHGTNTFAAVYGDAQEAYFARGNYTEREELVAGSPEYAFNEYLQVAVEWGIPVLVLLLAITIFCLFSGIKKQRTGISAAILSLLIFAFSSYPFQLPVFVVTFVFLLSSAIIGQNKYVLSVFALFVGATGFYLNQHHTYEACRKWNSNRMLYQMGANESAIKEFSALYPDLKTRPAFLFEYGHAYHKSGEYTRSTKILLEASQYSCDPMIFNIIGKNYQQQGEYEEAEKWFLRSANRLPGRIYPYYLLAKLYAEPEYDQPEKFREAAGMVLTKEPKVQSTAIKQMREEIRKLMKKED